MAHSRLTVRDYHVGWICAIDIECAVACELLDQEHSDPADIPADDENIYTFGRIKSHNVVIACLPRGRYGTTSAACVARDMQRSFPAIRIRLMVGIAGGAPTTKHDIRLGDVVVSSPVRRTGEVIHYDHGKTIQNRQFEATGSLDKPSPIMLQALQKLSVQHERKGHAITQTIELVKSKTARFRARYRKPDVDILFKSSFVHRDPDQPCSSICNQHTDQIITRHQRDPSEDDPCIHYGLIASADRLMKDALLRDHLAQTEDVLCFEMEAAGLMDRFPCIVIRGISDYSDTHKNDQWQRYAAATAAAYAMELLSMIPATTKSLEISQLSGDSRIDGPSRETVTPDTPSTGRESLPFRPLSQQSVSSTSVRSNGQLPEQHHMPDLRRPESSIEHASNNLMTQREAGGNRARSNTKPDVTEQEAILRPHLQERERTLDVRLLYFGDEAYNLIASQKANLKKWIDPKSEFAFVLRGRQLTKRIHGSQNHSMLTMKAVLVWLTEMIQYSVSERPQEFMVCLDLEEEFFTHLPEPFAYPHIYASYILKKILLQLIKYVWKRDEDLIRKLDVAISSSMSRDFGEEFHILCSQILQHCTTTYCLIFASDQMGCIDDIASINFEISSIVCKTLLNQVNLSANKGLLGRFRLLLVVPGLSTQYNLLGRPQMHADGRRPTGLLDCQVTPGIVQGKADREALLTLMEDIRPSDSRDRLKRFFS